MGQAIRFSCSSCDHSIKVASRLSGRSGKCPSCGSKVRVPRPAAMRVAVAALAPTAALSGRASTWKDCAMCGESIRAVAIKCRHCGERFDRSASYDSATDPNADRTRMVFMVSGILIIGVGLLIALNAMLAVASRGGGAIIPALINCVIAIAIARLGFGVFNRERTSFVLLCCLGGFVLLSNLAIIVMYAGSSGSIVYVGGMRLGWLGLIGSLAFNAVVYGAPIVYGIRNWNQIAWADTED